MEKHCQPESDYLRYGKYTLNIYDAVTRWTEIAEMKTWESIIQCHINKPFVNTNKNPVKSILVLQLPG